MLLHHRLLFYSTYRFSEKSNKYYSRNIATVHLNIYKLFHIDIFTRLSVCSLFQLINMANVVVVPFLFNVDYSVPVKVDFMTVSLKERKVLCCKYYSGTEWGR